MRFEFAVRSGKACSDKRKTSLHIGLTRILDICVVSDEGETCASECVYETAGNCRDVYVGSNDLLGSILRVPRMQTARKKNE